MIKLYPYVGFADSGFENVWAVIPFDETHLTCAFGDETDEQTKQLTKYFYQ